MPRFIEVFFSVTFLATHDDYVIHNPSTSEVRKNLIVNKDVSAALALFKIFACLLLGLATNTDLFEFIHECLRTNKNE